MMMVPGAEVNGRGFKMQMCLKPQVHFSFFLFLFSSFLDYTNDYLETVDMYSHHHHCSTRKQQQGLKMACLEPLVWFFFSIIFSSFSFICILSFNLFPPLFVLSLSIWDYCIPTCSQFTYLSILLILMLPILYHTCSSILLMSTFYWITWMLIVST